jgi:hypothetical protein
MTRRTTRTTKAAPAEGDLKVTPEEGKIESPVTQAKPSDPVNLEVENNDEEPVAPAPAVAEAGSVLGEDECVCVYVCV